MANLNFNETLFSAFQYKFFWTEKSQIIYVVPTLFVNSEII